MERVVGFYIGLRLSRMRSLVDVNSTSNGARNQTELAYLESRGGFKSHDALRSAKLWLSSTYLLILEYAIQ